MTDQGSPEWLTAITALVRVLVADGADVKHLIFTTKEVRQMAKRKAVTRNGPVKKKR